MKEKMLFLLFVSGCIVCFGQQHKDDSVTYAASRKYLHSTIIKRFFLGKNYRKEWSQPVKMPVFHMSSTNGGFTATGLGGGMQTKSLKLRDKKDIDWALRTVDKDVVKALPKLLQHTFVVNIAQEVVSGALPYAPLIVGSLAKSAGVIAADPQLFFVPDDPAFGGYQSVFANKICMLEQREPTPDHTDTKSTEKVIEKLRGNNKITILQKAVLKARLLDMLISDWDRHALQWQWGERDSANGVQYYGIPKDRDQAMFLSNGLLIKLATYTGMPALVGFRKTYVDIIKLNFKSWGFDQLFLNELDTRDWTAAIEEFEQAMNDSALHAAVLRLPAEVYATDGKKIEEKLRHRMNHLLKAGLKYYRYLSSYVTINGSEKEEIFRVSGEGKNVRVTVSGKDGLTIYARTFLPEETYKIILNGFRGGDVFEVDNNTASKIKLNIYGEKSNDTFHLQGKLRTRVFEASDETENAKKAVTKSD